MNLNFEGLTLDEAIAFLAAKRNLDTESWVEGMGLVQEAFFTVAKAKGDFLQEIRNAVEAAIAQGKSVPEFRRSFEAISARWAETELYGNRAWRAQLIFEMNLRKAYAKGREKQLRDPAVMAARPYWLWRHGGSQDARPTHLAMDGRVVPAGSLPIHPWGFGCRCQFFSLSPRDLERQGLVVENIQLGDRLEVVVHGERAMAELRPDPGFGVSTDRADLLKNLSPRLRALVEADADPS
jgi:uncharacterized protein with gpF-like domain